MRANDVGTRIRGNISFRQYIVEKYDGLFPDNYPSKEDYRRALAQKDLKAKSSMDRKIRKFQREWQKQQ